MEYCKRLKEQVEAHETKGRSLHMRRNTIKAQQLANYQNEQDKILEQSITKREQNKEFFNKLGANEEMFKKRKKHLEKLGARAIDGIPN